MKFMGHKPIEELLPRSGFSVYRLVRMAANRALELSEGKPCLIENPTTDKVTTTALEEIAAGKVESLEGVKWREEAEKAEQEQSKTDS